MREYVAHSSEYNKIITINTFIGKLMLENPGITHDELTRRLREFRVSKGWDCGKCGYPTYQTDHGLHCSGCNNHVDYCICEKDHYYKVVTRR
jgi:rubrerythrin